MFRLRNLIEAGVLGAFILLPLFRTSLSLTIKIIIACVTALPLCLLALIGVSGESLSSFILSFFQYLRNRRILNRNGTADPGPRTVSAKKSRRATDDFEEEFDEPAHKNKYEKAETEEILPKSPAAAYLPIQKIQNGVIYTRDHRYVKIIEVSPINFLLHSAQEQRSIIYSFVSYLKISPIRLQFKVLTKKADVNRHLYRVEEEIRAETDERCRALQQDYAELVRRIGYREAITRRFFIIFEYEGVAGTRKGTEEDALSELQSAVQTAAVYLRQCGNEVIQYDDDDAFTADLLYNLLNRNTACDRTLEERDAILADRQGNREAGENRCW